MKLRNVLAGGVGAVAVTAVANRALRATPEEFEPFLDGDQGTYRWRGFDVAYTERGDPEDPDLLLLHGLNVAASNHLFDRVLEPLAQQYHVIVPDLPGFGHSDRPPLLYSSSLYETFVADVIADLSDGAPTVVASSLTGTYTALAAREVDVERLVLACPTDSSSQQRRVWLRTLLRSPFVGEALFNLAVSEGSIRYFNADHGYYDPGAMTDAIVEYEHQTAHQPGARFAPASFAAGFLDPEEELAPVLADVSAPVTLVWGRDAETTPLEDGRRIAETGDTDLVVFDDTKLLPHVEHPDAFVEVVRDEIPATA